jgi:putative oxidoreductase
MVTSFTCVSDLALARPVNMTLGLRAISEFASVWAPRFLALLRIMTAAVILQHGLQKLISFPIEPVPGYTHLSMAGLAAVLEVVAMPMIIVGFHTRACSFVMSGLLAAAYFLGHGFKGFYPLTNGGDVAVLGCFIFLYLAVAGGGAWTLDGFLIQRRDPTAPWPVRSRLGGQR